MGRSVSATLNTVGTSSLTAGDSTNPAVTTGSRPGINVISLTAGIGAVPPTAPVVAVRGQPLTFALSAAETGQPARTGFT